MPARSLTAAAAAAAIAVALSACGDSDAPKAPAQSASGLSSEAGKVVGGGPAAFQAQLRKLKGTPVVVNQWASWCGPCKFEFPFLERAARKYQDKVAFLGVNSNDSRDGAESFLKKHPVPYPNFFDPSIKIARTFKGGLAWPTTAYYNRAGKLVYTHPGAYASQAKLEQDIRQYALSR